MTFARPWCLSFLIVLPLIALGLVIEARARKKALLKFAESGLLAKLTGAYSGGRVFLKGLLLILAAFAFVTALAGPRFGSHYEEIRHKGVDIMVVADTSPSMLAQDVAPTRLERAKREIYDLLRVIQGDRLGLTAFAGEAFVQCPLTLDYAAIEMYLSELGPDAIPVPGTDLGAAIETATKAFDTASSTDKVIILITDGEDNEGRGVQAAREAAAKGIKIFVYGIGSAEGAPVPSLGGDGGFMKDEKGGNVMSKLDEKGLSEIASISGGRYVRAVTGDLDLDLLYYAGIKRSTTEKELGTKKVQVFEERFQIFACLAFILLLLEWMIERRRKTANDAARAASIAACVLLALLLPLGARAAGDHPDELYKQGKFKEAQAAYQKLGLEDPSDLRYRYNRGCAAYGAGDYDGAKAAFESVVRRSSRDDIQFRALHNLGNTHFKQNDFEKARDSFREALKLKPDDADARHNLELALKAIKKQQESKQQKEGESGQKDGKEGKGDKKDQNGKSQGKDQNQESGKQDQQGNGQKESGSGEKQDRQQQNTPGRQEKQQDKQDVNGELKGRDMGPPTSGTQAGGRENSAAMMEKRKAEALLDNVREDRARLKDLKGSGGGRAIVGSGKEW